MDNVNNVLNKVMSSLGLDRRLKEHTLASMWPTFVPGNVAQRSRPLFIDSQCNLVVSVADASTGQELSMLKSRILTKLIPAARSLSIDIRGLRLDMKYYRKLVEEANPAIPDVQPQCKPNETELSLISLTDEEQQQLSRLQDELDATLGQNRQLAERIFRVFELELRTRRWQLQKGFPRCRECGNPAERLHSKNSGSITGATSSAERAYCLTCIYAD